MSPPVFRFAPSPNGHLHLGHALSALLSWEIAQAHNGRFLLRIEDIDIDRCRPEFEAQIYEDLEWLGLEWEEPVRRQSEHFDTYRQALGNLEIKNLLYPCFATRKEIAKHANLESCDPDGAPLYPGLHKNLTADEISSRKAKGEPFALRLDLAKAVPDQPLTYSTFDPETGDTQEIAARPERWGDTVIARKDVPASYHLCVVVDDALQGVTHVTRGQDLEAATDIHRLLQHHLGLPAPLYHHHRLLNDDKGRKLSKSEKDTSLISLRKHGATPDDIRAMIGLTDFRPRP